VAPLRVDIHIVIADEIIDKLKGWPLWFLHGSRERPPFSHGPQFLSPRLQQAGNSLRKGKENEHIEERFIK